MRRMNLDTAEARFLADGGTAAKALDDLLDFGTGGFLRRLEERRHILAKWHCRWCEGALVQTFGRLLAGVIELHPDGRSLIGSSPRPLLQDRQVSFIFDHHIARLTQSTTIDHHIAGQDQTNTGGGPTPVEPDQRQGRAIVVSAQRLTHGRLGQTIRQHTAAGQAQLLRQEIGGERSGL